MVLPSLGWHLALALEWLAGRDGATVIVAIPLAVVVGAMLATQPPNRLFVVNALLAGFFFSMFGTTLTPHLATQTVSAENEPGSRYTTLPIFLIECIAVVGVDCVLRQRTAGVRHRRGAGRPAAWVVYPLVVVLAASWVADFRYAGIRSNASWNWGSIAAEWEHACERSRSGVIVERPARTATRSPAITSPATAAGARSPGEARGKGRSFSSNRYAHRRASITWVTGSCRTRVRAYAARAP